MREEAEARARRIAEGAEEGEREKILGWYTAAYRVAMAKVPEQDVDDVAQETVLDLLARERQGVHVGVGLAYLVAKSVVHSYYDEARGRRIGDRSYRPVSGGDGDSPETIPAVEDALVSLEENVAALQVLESLPVRIAQTVLRYVAGEQLAPRERMALCRMRKEVRALLQVAC